MKRILLLMMAVLMSIDVVQAQWQRLYLYAGHENENFNVYSNYFNYYGVCCITENTVYACGDSGIILKSTNGGNGWKLKHFDETETITALGFANKRIGYAGGYKTVGGSQHNILFKTVDYGNTWEEIPTTIDFSFDIENTGSERKFVVLSPDTLFVYNKMNVFRSIDGGQTFNVCYESNYDYYDFYSRGVKGLFFDDSLGFVVNYDSSSDTTRIIKVKKTTDYGDTWTEVGEFSVTGIDLFEGDLLVNFVDKNHVRFNQNGHIIETTDGFETVSQLQGEYFSGSIGGPFDCKFNSSDFGCYVSNMTMDCLECDRTSSAFVTTDGGLSWHDELQENFGFLDKYSYYRYMFAVDGIDSVFYVVSEDGAGYRYGTPHQEEEPTFASQGSEWYFNLSSFMGSPVSYYKMEVLGDTLVQGHTCSIITHPYIGGNGGNQYVYEENKVVYWYNATTDSFTTLYDFNANEGDSWTCDIDSCSYQVTVMSIDSVTWDGHTYRVQNVTSDDPFGIMHGKIIDGIGYEDGLFPYMWACEEVFYDGEYPNYLRCYFKDGEMLYHEGGYYCDETQKTDRWIFPLVFTDASNNPDTVWFVQHDYVTTLEDILNEEGINPNVRDENEFRVYFMQDGEKIRVVSSHFDEAFIKEQIYADNYVFPITMNWRKILLEQYFELIGPMAHTSLESAYTQSGFSIEGVEVIDGETEWYGVFNTYETTGPQPAAVFSEEGTYYGNEEMLQSFYNYQTFFPLSVSMSRSCLYHAGSLSGLTANVEGNDVILDWFYTGCDYPEAFTVTRVPENESEAITFTTSETAFVDHGVPAGHYTYAINAYYSDGTYISDGIVTPYYSIDVTIEPDFASQGFEWYYELQNPDGSTTYQHLYYLADTTIREKDIDIIVRTNTLYDKGTNTTHEYIYEEEGKVFWWNATIDDFTMLYDFTAMPGDEWEIKVGTESITMHVDAVGETEYNGKIFKTLQVSDAGNLFSGTIVAKVGHLTSFFPERLMRKSGESTVEGLRCLWNGTELVFKYGDKDCDEIYEQLHYGLKDVETEAFSLYPNPTEGVLTVETQNLASPQNHASLQKQTTYRILNFMGQTLLEGRTEGGSTRIDVSGLSDGMYFINIEGATQKFVVKK